MDPPTRPAERADAHNVSVDEDISRAGGCGQVHLPTGNTCALGHGHLESCDFVPLTPQEDEPHRSHLP